MPDLPTGTVTFLFTDIEGSTRLWDRSPDAMRRALARHDELLRGVVAEHGGRVFKTVGDACYAAFGTAPPALAAALAAQRALLSEDWGEPPTLKVRMALHTGAAEERDGDYFGPALNRVARLLSAGHGGQVLLSLVTHGLVRDSLPPGAELRDLGEHRLKDLIRAEQVYQLAAADLPSDFPPLRTLDTRPNNLPLQPTLLVGREREVGSAREILLRPEVRLLTLTGPGGTGKTRLGLQVAAELLEEYEDGVYFVGLAALADPELVASTVAQALGVAEAGGQPLAETLGEYLRERRLLLVLDNFEQVLEAAPLVEELLAKAPGLNALATSRAPLRLYGEREFPVPPLALPDPKHLPALDRLTQYEGVRLFIERARDARPDFEVTSENAPAVAEICARLDGLPLAIELAAARIKLLTPQAMLARLSSRLRLLTGGARNLPARQQTLRGAIEWSYGLLDGGEQQLFARLSVFSGGRTLDAVEAVCDAEGDLGLDALDGVSSLLDKSLLRQEEGTDGEPRYAMLETIHEYAREKLEESGEAEEFRRRHAEYFLALAEQAEPELTGPRQVEWFDRLEADHDNLRAALGWAMERGEAEIASRLRWALTRFWLNRGHLVEGRRWHEEVLPGGGALPAQLRAKALFALGVTRQGQGDFGGAVPVLEESLVLSRELDDPEGIRRALGVLGLVALGRSEYERAEPMFEESLALARRMDDKRNTAWALSILGSVAQQRGNFRRASSLQREGLNFFRELGDVGMVADCLLQLGNLALAQGELRNAVASFGESEQLFRQVGDIVMIAGCLNSRGLAALYGGEYEEAEALLGESVRLQRELSGIDLSAALANLGWLALERRNHREATMLFEESLALDRDCGVRAGVLEGLEGLAATAGASKLPTRAARLFGRAEAMRVEIDVPMPPIERARHERHLDTARVQLDRAAWEAARAEGRSMPMEQAVEYALSADAEE